ncbi:hypothetical protein [Streptomyces longwoodensis]|uniref:hypothetical protein n=1 Tax=Streptomyces longwoodensis TaxID=68231 RepID=UPI002251F10E|nr:hypothetical protein [Streptomyces longwoodensis]MCX5001012.1 hypothetical protein [Streptomyces longwoodensis]
MDKQRLTTNLVATTTAAMTYGGSVAAGLAFYQLLDSTSAIAITAVIIFSLIVAKILQPIATDLTGAAPRTTSSTATSAANTDTTVPDHAEEAHR